MTETPRHACRVCTRKDLSLTANGRVRSHAADGKRPGPDNPNCPGGSDLPRDPEQDLPCFHPNIDGIGRCKDCSEDLRPTIAEVDAAMRAALGDAPPEVEDAALEMMERQRLYGTRPEHSGPNPYRAPLPTGNLPHDRHTDPQTEDDPWQTRSTHPTTAAAPDPGSTPATTATVTDAVNPSTRETSSAPTVTAGTRGRTAAVTTETADAFDSATAPVQRAEQKVERDGFGRYRLIHPVTGKKQAWQRCTTFAKMLEDTFGLGVWQQRMVAKGLALRPDLLDVVATLEVKRDAEQLNRLLEQAKDAAGSKVAANQGTVCHKHTEDVDRGDSLDDVPPRYRADVTAYVKAIRDAGITIVPELIERVTAVPDLGVGGTLDRVVRDRHGKYRILDVKTGNMDFGQLGICVQLAVYAAGVNTAGVYDLDTGTWQPPQSYGDSIGTGPWSVPKVETDYALVAHIPVGSGTCELLKVPIDTGWEAVQTAVQVRDWRKMKRLFTPYDPEDGSSPYLDLLAKEVGDPGTVAAALPTWEQKFRAVSSRAEAAALYSEAFAELGNCPRMAALVSAARSALETRAG